MKRRNILPPKVQTTEELEKAVKSLHRADTHPYNFKIPIELYDEIQSHMEKSGQTLKSFLVFSIKEYLKNNRIEK